MRLRHILPAIVFTCLVCMSSFAQETAKTKEELLDALDVLWQQYDRLPTDTEIDQNENYSSAQYLANWENWAAVREALGDHLYQKGVLAALRGDRTTASEFYRRCLEANPNHVEARAAYALSSSVDLDEAARERSNYTGKKAGPEAANAYRLYTIAYSQNRTQEATQHYLRAQRLKEEYVAAEVERMTNLYEVAVTTFEKEDFSKARSQFQELSEISIDQAGYSEVIQPRLGDIQRYLTRSQEVETGKRVGAVFNITRSSRAIVWISGAIYALPSDMGFVVDPPLLRLSPSAPKVGTGAFVGTDVGASFRVMRGLWAGGGWSWMLRSPTVKYTISGFQGDESFDGGSIHSYSAFLQSGGFVSPQVRLYGQGGVAFYRINLPEIELQLLPGRFLREHKENPVGFFLGGGADLWNTAIGNIAWGVRLDLKYYIVNNKAQALTGQKLKLNGARVALGVAFALGSSK